MPVVSQTFGVKFLYVFCGTVLGVSLAVIFSAYPTQAQTAVSLIEEQEYSKKFTGEYFTDVSDPDFTINTYETVCKGYYTIEDNVTSFIYKGYGDLADEYTYTLEKPQVELTASSTPKETPIYEEIPLSTTTIAEPVLSDINLGL